MKGILIALLAIAVLGGAYYVYVSKSEVPEEPAVSEHEDVNTTTSGMRAEENAVVTPEQRPGNTVTVAQVYLAAPGYVVIHEDINGQPGTILGSSSLLQAGESGAVVVTLSRPSRDGERLHAMLHAEMNDNSTFDAPSDTPVQSRLGGPLMGWFEISSEADENVQVTL